MNHSNDQKSFAFVTTLSIEQVKGIFKECFEEFMRHMRTNPLKLTDDNGGILTVKQAAKLTGLAVSTIYEKTSRKLIPHFKKGKRLYFKRTELEAWILGDRVQTQTDLEQKAMDYLLNRDRKK